MRELPLPCRCRAASSNTVFEVYAAETAAAAAASGIWRVAAEPANGQRWTGRDGAAASSAAYSRGLPKCRRHVGARGESPARYRAVAGCGNGSDNGGGDSSFPHAPRGAPVGPSPGAHREPVPTRAAQTQYRVGVGSGTHPNSMFSEEEIAARARKILRVMRTWAPQRP